MLRFFTNLKDKRQLNRDAKFKQFGFEFDPALQMYYHPDLKYFFDLKSTHPSAKTILIKIWNDGVKYGSHKDA